MKRTIYNFVNLGVEMSIYSFAFISLTEHLLNYLDFSILAANTHLLF